MSVAVKICGIKTEEALAAAVENGADYVGFVFFPSSPRYVTPQDAAELAALVDEEEVRTVALFVDPTDAQLDAVMARFRPDFIQLHGAETPERVDAIRDEYGLPVIKAIGVAEAPDIEAARVYEDHADMLLFDAKPAPDADLPGGNAQPFNWALMKGYAGALPWLLAGGLTPVNLAEAVAASGAVAVDVSSGVEKERGVKDPALITAFLSTAKSL